MKSRHSPASPNAPSACVVDGTLVLTLPDAVSPVIWRFDLGQAKASAIEVRTEEDGMVSRLILKTPKGEVNEIALYASRAAAVNALMAIGRAMGAAQSRARFHTPSNDASAMGGEAVERAAPAARRGMGRAATAFVAAALVVALMFAILNIGPRRVGDDGMASSIAPATGAGGADGAGVPVSADSFLRQQP